MIEFIIGALLGGAGGYYAAYVKHRALRDAKGRFIKRGWF